MFRGRAVGAAGLSAGEVVFNTAMTGYQEILTDPSYCRQIVTLTYPHIGNTGTNPEDDESAQVFAAGLVVRDVPATHSSWRARSGLTEYLVANGVVAVADIDTRRLTRLLREKGAQNGCVVAGRVDVDRALAAARAFPGLAGMDLAKVVSTAKPYQWHEGVWDLGKGHSTSSPTTTASSATSCGCWSSAAPASACCRRRRAQAMRSRCGPTGCSSRTALATRSRAITRSGRSGNCLKEKTFRCSGSASDTS